MQKTRLNGYVYDFSADYDAIAVVDILDIHKHLIKNNEIFVSGMMFFACNLLSMNLLEFVSMKIKNVK